MFADENDVGVHDIVHHRKLLLVEVISDSAHVGEHSHHVVVRILQLELASHVKLDSAIHFGLVRQNLVIASALYHKKEDSSYYIYVLDWNENKNAENVFT